MNKLLKTKFFSLLLIGSLLISGGGKLQTLTRGSSTLTPGWVDPDTEP